MYSIRIVYLVVVFSLVSSISFAQSKANADLSIQINGIITGSHAWPDTTGRGLGGAVLEVFVDGAKVAQDTTTSSGKYKLKKVPYSSVYHLVYKHPDFLTKVVEVDVSQFAKENTQQLGLDINVVLYRNNNYIGVNFLKTKPFGKGYYDVKKKQIIWDEAYTEELRYRLDAVLRAYGE